MKKFMGLILAMLILLSASAVSAGKYVYPGGKIETTVTFHNGSGWFVKNGSWIFGDCNTFYGENGKFYIPMNYLKTYLGFSEAYRTEDGAAVYAKFGNTSVWQVIGSPSVSVNGVWYDDAPAYVDDYGTVMVPLDVYSYPAGYSYSAETPEDYPEGKVTVSKTAPMNYSRVEVNKKMQLVTVFGKDMNGIETPVWYAVCSTGAPGEETVEGRFYLKPLTMGESYKKWYLFTNSGIWIVNCTQIMGDYCFHSILFRNLFNPKSLVPSSYYDIGKKATNGCVRLTVGDAAFVYDNCGGLPCDIGPGYYSDELAAIKEELKASLPETAEEYIKGIS